MSVQLKIGKDQPDNAQNLRGLPEKGEGGGGARALRVLDPPPSASCCESLFGTAEPFTPEGLSIDFVNRLRAGTLWAQTAARGVKLAQGCGS